MNLDLDGFELVKISHNAHERSKSIFIRLSKAEHIAKCVYLSRSLCEKCNFKPGDRVDLYRNGNTFCLRKANVGCLTIRKNGSNGAKITSVNLWLTLHSILGDNKLTAICDNNMVMFGIGD